MTDIEKRIKNLEQLINAQKDLLDNGSLTDLGKAYLSGLEMALKIVKGE